MGWLHAFPATCPMCRGLGVSIALPSFTGRLMRSRSSWSPIVRHYAVGSHRPLRIRRECGMIRRLSVVIAAVLAALMLHEVVPHGRPWEGGHDHALQLAAH